MKFFLQELLSKVILELQKDRYFETLQGRYWNSTMRNNCPVLDDSEGIFLMFLKKKEFKSFFLF